MKKEKRGNRRIRFERPARITTSMGKKSSVRSCDFSMQGAGFTCRQALKVGEKLSLTLDVGKPGESRIMKIPGKIVHQSRQDGAFLVGMCFFEQ